ncbi:hypothetical protein [Vibrio scophthalmi]|uniref:Fimbrial protein n=1 Tax=Vibrio scophthalmi TaxID=45658 RepID=A0A1E3WIF9_9VIBR|nr:hypothetical protein [Vibrio scophthalmi]ODS05583.1 hypothetical protein VSF3289_04724 [Vibrio scophthalmi]
MKKILLVLASASALILSASAFATFEDAPKGYAAGASLKVKISGAVIPPAVPTWMWRIPEGANAGLADLDVHTTRGVLGSSNKISYDIEIKNRSILEGYMKIPAAYTGAGLVPVVAIGSSSIAQYIGGKIPAMNGGSQVGELQFLLGVGAATAYLNKNTNKLEVTELKCSDQRVSSLAVPVLKKQEGFDITYAGATSVCLPSDVRTADNAMVNSSYRMISAARHVELLSLKLIVDDSTRPTAWSATLPITITLK